MYMKKTKVMWFKNVDKSSNSDDDYAISIEGN